MHPMINPLTLWLKDVQARQELRSLLVEKVIWRLKIGLLLVSSKLCFTIYTLVAGET